MFLTWFYTRENTIKQTKENLMIVKNTQFNIRRRLDNDFLIIICRTVRRNTCSSHPKCFCVLPFDAYWGWPFEQKSSDSIHIWTVAVHRIRTWGVCAAFRGGCTIGRNYLDTSVLAWPTFGKHLFDRIENKTNTHFSISKQNWSLLTIDCVIVQFSIAHDNITY